MAKGSGGGTGAGKGEGRLHPELSAAQHAVKERARAVTELYSKGADATLQGLLKKTTEDFLKSTAGSSHSDLGTHLGMALQAVIRAYGGKRRGMRGTQTAGFRNAGRRAMSKEKFERMTREGRFEAAGNITRAGFVEVRWSVNGRRETIPILR